MGSCIWENDAQMHSQPKRMAAFTINRIQIKIYVLESVTIAEIIPWRNSHIVHYSLLKELKHKDISSQNKYIKDRQA